MTNFTTSFIAENFDFAIKNADKYYKERLEDKKQNRYLFKKRKQTGTDWYAET